MRRRTQACSPSGRAWTRSATARTVAGFTAIWRAARSLGRSPAIDRVPNFSHYEAIRAENETGASHGLEGLRVHMITPFGP
jgi:hypothetical protein